MNVRLKAIILAGGQGTRFWPISRVDRPKQFLSISSNGESLIQATARRVSPLVTENGLWIIANQRYQTAISMMLPKSVVVSEPIGRNTAASIGLAAALVSREEPETVLLILPADHAVADEEKFRSTVVKAVQIAAERDLLVTIGIPPEYPHTGYGYIQRGEPIGTLGFNVARFFEKPSLERAKRYVEAGSYYWNSGIFAWRASVILQAFKQFLPEMHRALCKLCNEEAKGNEQQIIDSIFPSLESISIDFGVLEHARNCAVVPAEPFGWNDVGSWDAWAEHFGKDPAGNLLHGDAIAIDCRNCIVHSEKRLTAVVGAEDLVVIDAGDALLVCPRDKVQDVRKVVEELKLKGRTDLI